MLLFLLLLFLVGTCLLLLLPALWAEQIYHTYREGRTVNCPETHAPVSVRFNALRAAWSGLSGPQKLRLTDCTRWPEHADCGQECVPDAVLAKPASFVDHVSVANEKSRAFARAARRRGGVGAGHGLALPILVPSAMGEGAWIERPTDACIGTNDGAASAEPGGLHTVRLRRCGTAAFTRFAYVDPRSRSGCSALVGDLRSDSRGADGVNIVAGGAAVALDRGRVYLSWGAADRSDRGRSAAVGH